jgi:hypothetical protein
MSGSDRSGLRQPLVAVTFSRRSKSVPMKRFDGFATLTFSVFWRKHDGNEL